MVHTSGECCSPHFQPGQGTCQSGCYVRLHKGVQVHIAAGEFREDAAEYKIGRVGGDPLLVEPTFVEHPLMKGTLVGRPGEKGFPAKQQDEQLQPVAAVGLGDRKEAVVVARKIEDGRQVDFEELFGDGPGALVVETSARRW